MNEIMMPLDIMKKLWKEANEKENIEAASELAMKRNIIARLFVSEIFTFYLTTKGGVDPVSYTKKLIELNEKEINLLYVSWLNEVDPYTISNTNG